MDRKNIKILIVNKSQSMRTIIRDFLKNSGFSHMSSTENGNSAFLLAKENQMDLIIADFELADMNGFELLRQVREDKKIREIPFILVSSESEKKKVAQAGEYRVSSYVIKPFSQETLLEKVYRVLETKINPGEGLMCFYEGNRLAASGDLDAALAKYKQALAATQYSMAAIYYKIGDSYEKAKKESLAETNYKEAIGKSSEFLDALDALGTLELRRRKPQEALLYFRKGTSISPLNAARHLKIGESMFELEDFEGAEEAFKQSLELNPNQKQIYYRLGIALRKQGKLNEAEDYFNQAMGSSSDDENLHYNLGRVYFERGMPEKALTHLERAVELKPDFSDAKTLLEKVKGQ